MGILKIQDKETTCTMYMYINENSLFGKWNMYTSTDFIL